MNKMSIWEMLDLLMIVLLQNLGFPWYLSLSAALGMHFIIFLFRLSFGAVPWLEIPLEKPAKPS